MTNNDILRRLRYVFDYSDDTMMELFELGGSTETRSQISNWLKKDSDDDYETLYDVKLASFLNGVIIKNRGSQPGKELLPENKLNNNLIFRKLRIALNFTDNDILAIFNEMDLSVGKSELNALFRRPDHPQYRPCKDQFLRVFLQGLQKKYRK